MRSSWRRYFLAASLSSVLIPALVWFVVPRAKVADRQPERRSSSCPEDPASIETETPPKSNAPIDEGNDSPSREDESLESKCQHVYRHGALSIVPVVGSIGADCLSIYHGKRLLLSQSNVPDHMWLAFKQIGERRKAPRTFDGGIDDYMPSSMEYASEPFIDLNGDRVPDLIIVKNQGNGGETHLAYSLGKRARLLGTIEAIRTDVVYMDVDGDGKCEALTYDSPFFAWHASCADSVMPFVILKMGHERFELATSLMRTKPPSKARQNELIREWRGGCDVYIGPRFGSYKSVFRLSPQVWKDMLDLIYSGNSKTAFRMLKKFWTPNTYAENLMYEAGGRDAAQMSRRQFEKALLEQLRHSAYLSELKQLNHADARICNLVQRAPRSREEL